VSFDKVQVKQKLAGVLPAYMMPDSYVVLEKMPFNSRHKIDYTALGSAVAVSDSSSKPMAGLSMQNSVVAKELLSMWAQVLGTPSTSISPDKNFFDIGGNSLLSVALIKQINAAFSKNLKITDLYIYSNINEMSRHISHESEILGQPGLTSNVGRRADNVNKMRTMRNRRDGVKV
jgi:acyl carrier protein